MTKSIFRRASALLLSVMLSASALCSGVTAAEIEQTTEEAGKPMVYHIDRGRTANLTVYKYEVPDASVAYSGSTGEKDDESHIPEDAKPLKGVTFAAYKFAELDDYFTEASSDIPKVEDFSEEKVIKKHTATTNADGIAVFNELPLGFYYVDEINGPAQITKKIEPFVLSLPLTNAEGSKWLYDVYAYPKNETGYGDASLQKLDSDSGEPIEGAEFTLESYGTDDAAPVETIASEIKTGENGIVTVTSLPAQTYYRFTETKAADESYILDSSVYYEFYIDPTGDMICDWSSIDESGKPVDGKAVENNTLVVKNEKPSIHKFILDEEKGLEGIDNTASISDTVYWKIRTTVPSEDLVKKLQTYTVTDTMSKGISYLSAEVYLDDQTQLKEKEDYTVEAVDELNVRFVFVPEKLAGAQEVIIYYNTTLTENAPLAEDIPNTSKLTYTNIVGSDSTYDVDSETPTVHTGGYLFVKTDGDKKLSGAKFALYATEEDAKEQKNALKTAVSDENGNVAFMGLAYGSFSADEEGKSINGVQNGKREYWIAEIEAPEHYSLMSGVARVEVNSRSHLPGSTKDIVNNLIPTIPQTGGLGVVLIIIGCCCLVVYALFFLFIIRKYQSSKKQMNKEHENE